MNKMKMRLFVGAAILTIGSLGYPAMSTLANSNTTLGAGKAEGIYDKPTGKLPDITATEIFGEGIGRPLDNLGQGVQNTYNNVSNFVQGIFQQKPPTPIQRDIKNSMSYGSTFGTKIYETGGKLVGNAIIPGGGDVAGNIISGGGDVVTIVSDGNELLHGGTTGYESESMNMFGDGLTGLHMATTIDKYVAAASGDKATAALLSVGGDGVGIGKEIVKSETMQNSVNGWMDKNGNPLWLNDMKIRASHAPQALIAGASPEAVGAYIIYGNKKDHKMDDALNKIFFNSKAKRESKAIQEARKKAQAARAKRQGKLNQRGKRNISEGKPVIYLYPEKVTEIEVAFAYPDELTEVIPDYSGSWRVRAESDGTLTDADGRQYEYLFYESETPGYFFQTEEGFVLPVENREEVLKDILLSYGLSEVEADGFVEYWCEYLEEDIPYRMYPQLNEIVDVAMPVVITPAPDSILRIWMLFEETDEGDDTEMQSPVIEPFDRTGYTAVEWGGMVR